MNWRCGCAGFALGVFRLTRLGVSPHYRGPNAQRTSPEGYLAKALRVYPGRANLAMFVVGDPGKRDAYLFELVGLEPDWKAVLYDMKNNQGLLVNPSAVPIEETQWVESDGGLMLMLATHPPSDCRTGNLEVHVTRQSSRKTAVVEFDLDPTAQGPGCYFM